MPNYRLLKEKSTGNIRHDCNDLPRPKPRNQQQRRANITTINAKKDNSDLELLRLGRTFIMTELNIIFKTKSTWYLDFYASQYLINN